MNYVVLDLEWNQATNGETAQTAMLPFRLDGEIIQIGAVRLKADFSPGEQFCMLIKPRFYPQLHGMIAKLTGIRQRDLEAGTPFPQAIQQFQDWCGENCTFFTWGNDDLRMLRQNLMIHGLESVWTENWLNLQSVFNAQTDTGGGQKSLKAAMEYFNIPQELAAHNALNDAIGTALLCQRLNLAKSVVAQYAGKSHQAFGEPPLQSWEVGLRPKKSSLFFYEKDVLETHCPVCGERLVFDRWERQNGRRFVTLARCQNHGAPLEYAGVMRLSNGKRAPWQAVVLLYRAGEEEQALYKSLKGKNRLREKKREKILAETGAKGGS